MRTIRLVPALLSMLLVVTGCTVTTPGGQNPETRRQNINAGVDNALAELYSQVPGSKEMAANARGVLVF
ncbi:MAG: hypothetical protein RL030_1542, partial [Pseudomonadota bacterium]